MIVVDPGVGSERRVICARCDGHLFLAPDNGVLCHIFDKNDRAEVVSVTDRSLFLKDISRTFHGRDIFSPVAANLAKGLSIEKLGPWITDYQKGEVARPEAIENGITGEVIHIDRFGNMITNLENSSLSESAKSVLKIEGTKLRAVSFYSEGNPGEPVILPGSCGLLEIAVNAGNAADVLNSKIGTKVSVFWS
jgi:S-adenosylmethionine hydrolase